MFIKILKLNFIIVKSCRKLKIFSDNNTNFNQLKYIRKLDLRQRH